MGAINPSLLVRSLGLLLIFLVPRLCLLNDARWTGEESWFFSEIYATAQGERWSALGTPVSGTRGAHPGPYFYWLLAPFAWSASPWLVSFGVALLDSIGHLLALIGIKTLWRQSPHRRVAVPVATLLLAVSPWALLYADRPWNSNLVSLPVGMAIFGFALWWKRSASWQAFGVLTIGLAILPSFHLSAPIIGLPMLAAVAWRWKRLTWHTWLAGAVLSLLIWTPYGLHEWKHSGSNSRGLLSRSLPAVSSASNSLLALSWPVRLVGPEIGYHAQRGYWSPYQPGAWLHPQTSVGQSWVQVHGGVTLIGTILGSLLMLILWLIYLWHIRRPSRFDPFVFLLVAGTLLGWALLIIAGRRAYPHYLHPLLPFYAGAVGVGFSILWNRNRLRWLIVTIFGVSLLTGMNTTHRFQHYNDRPYGLAANLFSIDILRRFGGARPVFCGQIGYRNQRQISSLARVIEPEFPLFSDRATLIHLATNPDNESVFSEVLWRQTAYGIDHILVLGPLPKAFGRLGCR